MRVDIEKLEALVKGYMNGETSYVAMRIAEAVPSLITELRETRAALEQAIDLAQIKLVDGIVVFGEHSLSRVECDCPELAKALVVEE